MAQNISRDPSDVQTDVQTIVVAVGLDTVDVGPSAVRLHQLAPRDSTRSRKRRNRRRPQNRDIESCSADPTKAKSSGPGPADLRSVTGTRNAPTGYAAIPTRASSRDRPVRPGPRGGRRSCRRSWTIVLRRHGTTKELCTNNASAGRRGGVMAPRNVSESAKSPRPSGGIADQVKSAPDGAGLHADRRRRSGRGHRNCSYRKSPADRGRAPSHPKQGADRQITSASSGSAGA